MRQKQTLVRLFSVSAALIAVCFMASSAFANSSQWRVISEHNVREDGTMSAQHIVEVVNQDSEPTPRKLSLSTFGRSVRGVTATSQDGEKITASVSQEANIIALTLPDFSGANRKWSFTVRYESEVLTSYGDTPVVFIEPLTLEGADIDSQTVTVGLDLSLGFAIQQGVEPNSSRVGIGSQLLTYESNNGLYKSGISYFFGEQSLVTATYQANVKNDGLWWKKELVVLPPDTNQQRVLLESISPQPSNMYLDADGNVIAEYSLSPKREIVVTANVQIQLSNLTYDVNRSTTINDVDAVLKERYTRQSSAWQPGTIESPASNSEPVADIVEKTANAVAATVEQGSSSDQFNSTERTGSLAYADVLVGELRALGVPSRVVVGRVVTDGVGLFDTAINHAWVEAYVPQSGWITIDPVHMSNADVFGSADIFHVGFALWGIEDDYPPLDLSNWMIIYEGGELPNPSVQVPEVSITKSLLFPGLSLQDMNVTMPAGQIIDGVFVKGPSDEVYEYGSLAPLQSASKRSFLFGGTAFSNESFQAATALAEGTTVVESRMNFVPFLSVIAVAVTGAGAYVFMRWWKNRDRPVRSKDTFIMHEEQRGIDIESKNLVIEDEEQLLDSQPSMKAPAPTPPNPPEYEQKLPSPTVHDSNDLQGHIKKTIAYQAHAQEAHTESAVARPMQTTRNASSEQPRRSKAPTPKRLTVKRDAARTLRPSKRSDTIPSSEIRKKHRVKVQG